MNDTWHVEGALLERYAAGDLADPAALSIEAHLVGCARCRSTAAPHVDVTRLDSVWGEVEEEVDAPRRTIAERALRRVGVSDTTARLLAVTPTLRVPWITTVAVVLFMAVLGSHSHIGQRSDLLLLVLAPLVPVLGTAMIFGSGSDVTAEVAMAAPMSNLWLVLMRTASVLVTSIALAGFASLLTPQATWMAVAWLIPALALTTATLALASRFRPISSAAVVATVWALGVVGNEAVAAGGWRGLHTAGPIQALAFHPAGQVVLFGVAVLAAAVIGLRRDWFEIEMEGAW